jgi:hypothetical protein
MKEHELGKPKLWDVVAWHDRIPFEPDHLHDLLKAIISVREKHGKDPVTSVTTCLLNRLVLSKQLVRSLDPDPRYRIKIIATGKDLCSAKNTVSALTRRFLKATYDWKTYSHPAELRIRPTGKVVLPACRKPVSRYPGTRAVAIQFVYHLCTHIVSVVELKRLLV